MFIRHVIGLSMLFYILTLLVFAIDAEPRISSSTNFLRDTQSKIGRLEYSIEGPPKIAFVDGKNGKDNLSYLMQFLGNRELLDSFIQLFMGNGKNPSTGKQQMFAPKILRPQRSENLNGEHHLRAAKTLLISENKPMQLQADQPINLPSKTHEFSLDPAPVAVEKSDLTLPPISNEWKNTLFGPKGLLTEIFHFVNEKRKQSLQKEQQADLSPAAKEFDFAKLLDALLLKSQNGNFDEPLPELPFIGICNRLSCGDIYRAIDAFKKSELFSNFQTAISLIHDPKGWDIIGQLLENPELIENFAGKSGNSIQDLWGKIAGAKTVVNGSSSSKSKGDMQVLPSDGDLGTDFTYLVEEKKGPSKILKPDERKMPMISLNIDETLDYYSALENGKEDEEEESIDIEENLPISTTSTPKVISSIFTTKTSKQIEFSIDRLLPKISESIDSTPEDYDLTVEKQVEETVPIKQSNRTNLTSYETSKEKQPYISRKGIIKETTLKPILTTKTSTSTKFTRTTRKYRRSTTTFVPITVKNFRREHDYYAMYYDEG